VSLPTMGAAFLWVLVFVYSILGAIDFGSSFWRWVFHLRGNWNAESVAATYVSPTWELINAFLVVIPVALVGLFPAAAYAFGTVLALPATLLLILLALRGAYLQFGYASARFRKHMVYVTGITGLLLPGVFIALLPLTQGGFVTRVGNSYAFAAGAFFSSIPVYLFMAFGITLALYLSALFLARYAQQASAWSAYHRFRRGALWMGPISLALGAVALRVPTPGGLAIVASGLHSLWFVLFLAVSLVCFALGYLGLAMQKRGTPVTKGRALWQLGFGIAQIVLSQFAYAVGHVPWLLYPYLTFANSASNHVMFVSTLLVLIIGLAILTPALLWFRSLFIVDAEYVATHAQEGRNGH